MTNRRTRVAIVVVIVGCGTSTTPAPVPTTAPTTAPTPTSVPTFEHDLSVFGEPFRGYIATAPSDAKLGSFGAFNWIQLTEEDRVALDWAPAWDNEIAFLAQDIGKTNIRKVSDTEIRYDRKTLTGVGHGIDVKIDIGGRPYRCYTDDPAATGATYSGPAMAEQIAKICRSIRKRL